MGPIGIAILVLAALVAIPLGVVAIIYLIVPLGKGVIWVAQQIFRFVFGEIADLLRFVGAIITSIFLIPLVIGNVIVGRWSASAHFGRAMQAEFVNAGRSLYRMAIGHPARLLCLTSLTDGIENRIPQAVAAAPGADRPSGRTGQFEGYKIVGSLQGGGSGSKLYVAQPDAAKLAAFARAGEPDVKEVVIKSFSLKDGSSLPQIVRENRALDAAKRLGLILEHELTAEKFFYVMRYVPGDSLGLVTQRLHAAAGSGSEGGGLGKRELSQVLDYSADLLRTLCHYHNGGLWHKDVKPDNIIISDGQAHLVDFGLITPLRSAMTLTTHGTEYFRDPEMVRMALKGVKVQDVDGTKFDVYAAGAVLYSMIENSFPAHGGLSQISRPCPEAMRWIVRRAMTDYDKRYESAAAMLADIELVQSAADPFGVKPADLPSVRGSAAEPGAAPFAEAPAPGTPVVPPSVAPAAGSGRMPFEQVWARIGELAGEVFRTKTGLEFAYRFDGAACYPSRTYQRMPREDFKTVYLTLPTHDPKDVSQLVQGSAYIRAILTDPRVADSAPSAAPTQPSVAHAAYAGSPAQPGAASNPRVSPINGGRVKPQIEVASWWSGKYRSKWGPFVEAEVGVARAPRAGGLPAAEQLRSARERAAAARARAHQRMASFGGRGPGGRRSASFSSAPNAGVVVASVAFLALCALGVAGFMMVAPRQVGLVPAPRPSVALTPRVQAPPTPPATVVPAGQMRYGKALVIRDTLRLNRDQAALVDGQLETLAKAGFDTVGNVPGVDPESPEAAEQNLLVATARNAIGLAPFQSEDAAAALRAWLADHLDFAVAVWVVGDDKNEPVHWVVLPADASPVAATAANAALRRK